MDVLPSVAKLVSEATPGDAKTMETLLPLVYKELRMLAAHYLNRSGPGHTLQPTALVHEAFVKMISADKQWTGREHFMAVAATAMRQVLVDFARAKKSEKRGGDGKRLDISIVGDIATTESTRELRVLELDDLLSQLAKADPRSARIAEMRLFGGMDQEQIARVLGVSRMTVTTDWQFARTWLAARVHGEVKVVASPSIPPPRRTSPEKAGE